MTSTIAAGGVRDITPHPHEKLQQFDSIFMKQQHRSPPPPSSSSTVDEPDYDNNIYNNKKRLYRSNNNNRSNHNHNHHPRHHKRFLQSNNGGVKSSGRRKAGKAAPSDNLSSDYDNIVPAATPVRLSRVEEEGGDGGEQHHQQQHDEHHHGLTDSTSVSIADSGGDDGSCNDEDQISDPLGDSTKGGVVATVNGGCDAEQKLTGAHAQHSEKQRGSVAVSVNSRHAPKQNARLEEEGGEKNRAEQHQSQHSGAADVDGDGESSEPALSRNVSASSDFVGIKERLLSGNELSASNNNNDECNRNHSSVDGVREDYCGGVRDGQVFLELGVAVDSDKVGESVERYDVNNSVCDRKLVEESCCDCDSDSLKQIHVNNVLSDSSNNPLDTDQGCNGTGDVVEEELIPFENEDGDFLTIKMGNRHSRRSKGDPSNGIADDHSKIEMKEYSRNGDSVISVNNTKSNGNQLDVNSSQVKSIDPIHGEIIDDENRSLSLDSYQTIPEFPEEYVKLSANASFEGRDRTISSTPTSFASEELVSTNNKTLDDISRDNDTAGSDTGDTNVKRDIGVAQEDSAPVYAVVNKKTKSRGANGLAKKPAVSDPNLMDGDYFVPSWGEKQDAPKSQTVLISKIDTTRQRPATNVNNANGYREIVSASVSVSSLASSKRDGYSEIGAHEKASSKSLANNDDDDEYDDAFIDPNNSDVGSCRLHKSSTMDNMPTNWKGSLKFPRSHSTAHGYFSLGRRPKLKRSHTLVDAHGKAVSMDTLLKARRTCSVAESDASMDNPSIEDILKSCDDFQAGKIEFRSRAESANSVTMSSQKLGFFLVKEEGNAPVVTNESDDRGFNNLNASVHNSSPSNPAQTMNIVNGEDVELRPRLTAAIPPNVSLSHSNHLPNNANVSIPPTTYSSLSTDNDISIVLCATGPVSNKTSGLTTTGTAGLSSYSTLTPHIPQTTPQHFTSMTANVSSSTESSLSPLSISSSSSSKSPSFTSPTTPPSNTTPSSQLPQHSTVTTVSSNPQPRQGVTNNSAPLRVQTSPPENPATVEMSATLVTSPLIKFHPDYHYNGTTDPAYPFPDTINSGRLLSPLSALSSEDGLSNYSPCSMTSLTVDVSSPAGTEGNSLQNSSPAPRSPNSLAKLEAVEALKWLRAAGFPQYAQMFDDGLFPIELALVEKDHDFLDKDSIQSLFRRLETLNKYAGMKIDAHQRKKAASEEDEEDDICALSERWEYQKSARRWSRKDLALSPRTTTSSTVTTEQNPRGSHDSLLADQDSESQTGDSPLLNSKMPHRDMGVQGVTEHGGTRQIAGADHQNAGGFPISPRLRRVASERIKTAKILWKKMEGGLKSKKSRRHPRNIMEISDPVVADQENMQAKLQRLNCVDISPTSEQAPGTGLNSQKDNLSHDGSVTSPSSTQSPQSPSPVAPQQNTTQPSQTTETVSSLPFRSRFALENQSLRDRPTFSHSKDHSEKTSKDTQPSHDNHHSISSSSTDSSFKEFYSAQSQLLRTLESAQPRKRSSSFRKNSNDTGLREIFLLPQDHQPGSFPRLLQNGYIETESRGVPSSSRCARENVPDNLGLADPVTGNRVSVYDNFSSSGDVSRRNGGVTDKSSKSLSEIHEDDSKNANVQSGDSSDRSGSCDSCSGDKNVNDNSGASPKLSYRELRDKILREASSPSLPLAEGDSSNQSSSFTYSKGVCHSVSVDSYLKDNGSNTSPHQRNSSGSSSNHSRDVTPGNVNDMQERSLSEQYDEFDLILKTMYDNIKDITKRVVKTTKDANVLHNQKHSTQNNCDHKSHPETSHRRKPTLTLPTANTQGDDHHNQGSVVLDTTEVVPMSPNSDPILSPSSPLSPRLVDDSIDTDGVTDPDNENSSSGGGDSHTGESISDPEVGLDLSHDDSLEQIPAMTRERRDSGVGHSLTRASSDRRRKKLRWHSFQKCHRPDISSRSMQINSLTVGQLVWLQKLSLLKLTGIMEKCLPVNKSGWNWMMPRFMKRNKTPDFSDKNVFGVPLSVMVQRTGQPLPQCVLYAMRYLRRTSQHAVGIFRKSGVKSKIQSLIDHLEANPDTTDFEDMNAYNVADMIKTFFRDLPECLLTNKLSETFRSIYTHVPKHQLLEAIQAAVLLLPDENREVLQSLLLFLSDISMHEADHQMNAVNLAVCFTPTVFMLGFKQIPLSHSPKRNRKAAPSAPGVPDPREIMEQKTSQDCLLLMITECKKLFTVPPKLFRQVQTQSAAFKESSSVFELSGEEGSVSDEIRAFGQERVQKVLKEAHDKNRGWMPFMSIGNIEISHRNPMDDCPLKEWKLVVDIDAPPIEVLRRVMHERHAWDEDLLSWSVVERLDPHSDIFQYVLNSMAPHPPRHFCVLSPINTALQCWGQLHVLAHMMHNHHPYVANKELGKLWIQGFQTSRYWRVDLSKGACALITMSMGQMDSQDVQGVMAVDFGSFYLMEPCGSGRSRLTHVTRMDTRGRCPEWYSKVFAHVVGNFIERLKDSFKQQTSGPETKV